MDKRNKLWRRQQMARVFKVWLNIHTGSNWQKINEQRFINLRELHAAAGFAEGKDTIVESIRRILCALSGNLQSRNRESHSLRI